MLGATRVTVDCPAAAEAVLSIAAKIAATTCMTLLLQTAGSQATVLGATRVIVDCPAAAEVLISITAMLAATTCMTLLLICR